VVVKKGWGGIIPPLKELIESVIDFALGHQRDSLR